MIYDIHLIDFLKEWLPGGRFKPDIDYHLSLTDSEIIAAIRKADYDGNMAGHRWARCLARRQHFRVLDPGRPQDAGRNPQVAEAICRAAQAEFGADLVRAAHPPSRKTHLEFPVLMENGEVVSALSASEALRAIPVPSPGYVYVDEVIFDKAKEWLGDNRERAVEKEMKGRND